MIKLTLATYFVKGFSFQASCNVVIDHTSSWRRWLCGGWWLHWLKIHVKPLEPLVILVLWELSVG